MKPGSRVPPSRSTGSADPSGPRDSAGPTPVMRLPRTRTQVPAGRNRCPSKTVPSRNRMSFMIMDSLRHIDPQTARDHGFGERGRVASWFGGGAGRILVLGVGRVERAEGWGALVG